MVSGLLALVTWHFDLLNLGSGAERRVAPPTTPVVQVQPPTRQPVRSRTIRLAPSPGLDSPAKEVAKWSVSDPRFGIVAVVVPVGQTPREALTVALAERGYQVIR
ncbi:MAG: hypothetical protein WKF65_09735 [Gaiellaceae bacterium]